MSSMKLKNYYYVLLSLLITRLGDGAFFIASNWLIITLTDDLSYAIYLGLFNSLFFIFSQPFITFIIDRYEQKKLAIYCDFILLSLNLLIFFLVYKSESTTFILILLSICFPIQGLWSSVSRILTRRSVEGEFLLKANSYSSIAIQSGVIFGVLVGGGISEFWGAEYVLLFNSFTFLLSALSIYRVSDLIIEQKYSNRNFLEHSVKMMSSMNNLLIYPSSRYLFLVFSIYLSVFPVVNSFLGSFVSSSIGGGAESFAIVDSAYGFGGILAGLIIPYLVKKVGKIRTIYFSSFLLSISLVAFGKSSELYIAALLFFFVGFFFHFYSIVYTELQLNVGVGNLSMLNSSADTVMHIISILVISSFLYVDNQNQVNNFGEGYIVFGGIFCVISIWSIFMHKSRNKFTRDLELGA